MGRPGYGLLRCPVCREALTPIGRTLACAVGHAFDRARSGYVNLLSGGSRRPARGGDSAEQIARRAAFLTAGHFDFVTDAILDHLRRVRPVGGGRFAVVEAGSGTGYHLDRLVAGLSGEPGLAPFGLGLDLSKAAIRSAARRYGSLAFAVADLWQDWPVRSGAVDLAVCLFAPKNFAETARVLRPDGMLAIAYPGPKHMAELRAELALMQIAPGKAEAYRAAAEEWFAEIDGRKLGATLHLSPSEAENIVKMGPNAARLGGGSLPMPAAGIPITCEVELLFASRPKAEMLCARPNAGIPAELH